MAQLGKNPPAMQGPGFNPWVGKIPWRRERLPTPVFWPGEFHGLYSCNVHGVAKSCTSEPLSLSVIKQSTEPYLYHRSPQKHFCVELKNHPREFPKTKLSPKATNIYLQGTYLSGQWLRCWFSVQRLRV